MEKQNENDLMEQIRRRKKNFLLNMMILGIAELLMLSAGTFLLIEKEIGIDIVLSMTVIALIIMITIKILDIGYINRFIENIERDFQSNSIPFAAVIKKPHKFIDFDRMKILKSSTNPISLDDFESFKKSAKKNLKIDIFGDKIFILIEINDFWHNKVKEFVQLVKHYDKINIRIEGKVQSGKSLFVAKLKKEFEENNKKVIIISNKIKSFARLKQINDDFDITINDIDEKYDKSIYSRESFKILIP